MGQWLWAKQNYPGLTDFLEIAHEYKRTIVEFVALGIIWWLIGRRTKQLKSTVTSATSEMGARITAETNNMRTVVTSETEHLATSVVTQTTRMTQVLNLTSDRLQTMLSNETTRFQDTLQLLKEQVSTLGQNFAALEQEVERQAPVQSDDVTATRAIESWNGIREIWAKTKPRMQKLVDEIPDGRRRTKYANMPRHSYQKVIKALAADGLIKDRTQTALLGMNGRFLALRASPRNSKPEDLQLFRIWYSALSNDLPDVNGEDDELA